MEILSVVKEEPVANREPPVTLLYQAIVPDTHPLAVNVAVPVPQILVPALVGAEGIAFTTTAAVAVELHPAADVTVTVYVPALAACALLIVGFCEVEAKLLGPAHE